MGEDSPLRERARQLIQAGRLPNCRPDRMWAGVGSGVDCAVCRAPIQFGKIEYELQFAPDDGASQGADPYHLHVRCFAAWYEERRELERATQALASGQQTESPVATPKARELPASK